MAALKSDYLRSILLRASIWKPLGSRAPLASLAALARSLRSPHSTEKFILEASWDLLEVVSNGVVLFLTVSVLLPKIIQKSTPKLPKSSPKPSRIHPKTFQNPPKTLQKLGLEGIVLRIAFGPFFYWICGRLGPSRAPLGIILEPSWGVWRRLGAVLARPRGGLGPSLGRPGASWGRLGSVLGHLGSVSGQFPRRRSVFYGFWLPTSMPET